ncbi:uncharacterized protein [Malus domestica]|uniref:uncharacterized protein n=1 Tax=Malus domestica TaxID=3750 RepID=UPI003975C02F
MRLEDEESDEEDEAWRNIQYVAAMAASMVCQPTKKQPQWGGSVAGRSYKPRNRAMTHDNLMNNYFNPNSVNPYFRQKLDRAGRPGFPPHQKVTIVLRMMVYASPADAMDDTYGISKSTYLDTLAKFCDTIAHLYKEEYLREPNKKDMDWLLRKAEDCGFPGMIGSLNCIHWNWKNCPT